MKKYAKPVIIFENFELNHSIANCSLVLNQSQDSCKYGSSDLFGMLDEGETVFSLFACTMTVDDLEEIWEDFCYQTGKDGFSLFTS